MVVKYQVNLQKPGSNKTTDSLPPDNNLKINHHDLAYFCKGQDGEIIYVMKPRIDRLSLTIDPEPEEPKIDLEAIKSILISAIKDPEDNHWIDKKTKSSSAAKYEINCTLKNPKTGAEIFVQAIPKKNSKIKRCFRLEFTPKSLTPEGIAFFKQEFVDWIFSHTGYGYFLKNASVTRFDIAVDMLNVRMTDLLYATSKKGKFMEYFSQKKELQSAYLGKMKRASEIYLYDKKVQQEDINKLPKFGDIDHLRVERRRRTYISLNKLGTLPHYKQLDILKLYCLKTVAPPEKQHHWAMFGDSCRHRGISSALDLLPDAQRSGYEEALKAAKISIWRPKKLWSYWAGHIEELGLVS